MTARRLYSENIYLKEGEAKIISIQPAAKGTLVTLDQTIFFPEGGGQSCDRGTLAGFPVIDVQEREGEIYHLLSCKPEDLEQVSDSGCVKMVLDWEHRFDNMQRHCGEHIVSGVFYRLYGGVNRGFHMGDQYMTIDISLEDNPEFETVTWDMCRQVELLANQFVWRNVPITVRRFETREEAAAMPLRKPLALDEDITIVTIGDLGDLDKADDRAKSVEFCDTDLADCVACCGTHPSTSAQVGMIKIYKVENNKGMYRIYLEAGQRAFCKYQQQYDVLDELGRKLSAGTEDILKKYAAQQEKTNETRQQLGILRRHVILEEAEKIRRAMTQNSDFVYYYDYLTLDDLMNLSKELFSYIPRILFLVHKPSNTVLLCSDGKPDCSKLVKENASIYGGKGGGNKNVARAIFSKEEYVDTFIDLIDKHLR